jgi:hypothetical protein
MFNNCPPGCNVVAALSNTKEDPIDEEEDEDEDDEPMKDGDHIFMINLDEEYVNHVHYATEFAAKDAKTTKKHE